MYTYKIVFMGFGNVGKALAKLLIKKKGDLLKEYSIDFVISGIRTKRHGYAIDPNGLDIAKALNSVDTNKSLSELNKLDKMDDEELFINNCQGEVFFESTPVNYYSGQPAINYLELALENGMHIVTANKGPVVHGYQKLSMLANSMGKNFLFESSVMDGAPIFSLFRHSLPLVQVREFRGILNSTTNLILCLMEEGMLFDEAVAYAQKIGIAETEPSGDIDGWDAAVKVAALAIVLMKRPINPVEVQRKGIREITPANIVSAKKAGKRWKLICSAKIVNNKLLTSISPELVESNSPFFSINGTTSMIEFDTDLLGKFSIIEQDPTPDTTAYGMFSDFISLVKS